jgi:serine/threonine protein kinase
VFVAKVMDLVKMSKRDKEYAYSEIKCLAHCNHPNIIKYVEDHEENEQLLIVMEFADAGDLDRQIKARSADNMRYFLGARGSLPVHSALLGDGPYAPPHNAPPRHQGCERASVVDRAHQARRLLASATSTTKSVSGVVANTFCRTPRTTSPPELWNNQRYSKKADVWSLGACSSDVSAAIPWCCHLTKSGLTTANIVIIQAACALCRSLVDPWVYPEHAKQRRGD